MLVEVKTYLKKPIIEKEKYKIFYSNNFDKIKNNFKKIYLLEEKENIVRILLEEVTKLGNLGYLNIHHFENNTIISKVEDDYVIQFNNAKALGKIENVSYILKYFMKKVKLEDEIDVNITRYIWYKSHIEIRKDTNEKNN